MSTRLPKFLYSYRLNPDGRGTILDSAHLQRWVPADGSIWVHIDIADADACKWLARDSGIPGSAVEILLAEETRPRSIVMDQGLLVVLRGVNTNPGDNPEDMVSVRVWLDANRVISTRRRRLLSIVDISEALNAGNGPRNPGALLAMLIERLADRIGDFVDSIENRLDAAEDEIGNAGEAHFRTRLASLRRQIAAVRRFVAPQRDALDRLNRQPVKFFDEDNAHALRQEADRITRYLEDLELARERAVVLQEELLSQIAQQQNARMYVLSVVAAIFLPLTFVTGLLGMNVGGLPGVDSPSAFVLSLIVMLVAGVGLLVFFRWKKWL
ncbi:MAG: zinc transporter ZntB [Burkholderiales bacterium]|nr:zinc transporter ZntB [Burkholderiales bacterium]